MKKIIFQASTYKKLKTKSLLKIVPALILLAAVSVFTIISPSIAHAACSPPATTYGTDTMSYTVSSPTTYYVWVRMQAPSSTEDSAMLQVDGGSCYNIGGSSSMPLNTWTWVNYQNGSSSQVISIPLTAGTHSLEIIFTEPSVSVDKILLLGDGTCVPTDSGTNFGTNCTPATTLPSTPTKLSAVATSPTSVSLSWTASTDTGGPGLKGYYILRTSAAGTTTLGPTSSSATSYIDNTVTANTNYSYSIEAADTTGNLSSKSAGVSVTTPTSVSTPQQPTTPTNVVAKVISSSQINLTWTASTSTKSTSIQYLIFRGQGSSTPKQVTTVSTNSYDSGGLSANTSYSYYIVALDGAGNKSVDSATVSGTTP
jgi:hypothetical protein